MTYRWRGGSEQWMQKGTEHRIQILIIEPLFEEKNRTRRLIADVMRGLEAAGIGSTLPDLPGTGESLVDIAAVSLGDWRNAAHAVADAIKPMCVASFRGGALLDYVADHVWRLAPETGARIVRDLKRTQLASAGPTPLYAGHPLSHEFLDELATAVPLGSVAIRTVRLESDPLDADLKIVGTPLWRRAEPGDDIELAAAISADLASWTMQCAAS
jgi:hypothetical protein